MVHVCEGIFVVFQVDMQDILGVGNRGSLRLMLNELAQEFFWFYLERRIIILVEWVHGRRTPRRTSCLSSSS